MPATGPSGRTVDGMLTRRGALVTVAVVALNVAVSMSAGVARWWGAFAKADRHGDLPEPVQHYLVWRRALREADTHVAMWLVAGMAVVIAAPRRSARLAGLAGLFVLSGAIEVAQWAFTTRSAQWGDLIGGAIGLALAALVGEVASGVHWLRGRHRVRRRLVRLAH